MELVIPLASSRGSNVVVHTDCMPLFGVLHGTFAVQVQMLMDLVCSSCGELMEDAVKKNMRIRVLSSDASKVRASRGVSRFAHVIEASSGVVMMSQFIMFG